MSVIKTEILILKATLSDLRDQKSESENRIESLVSIIRSILSPYETDYTAFDISRGLIAMKDLSAEQKKLKNIIAQISKIEDDLGVK